MTAGRLAAAVLALALAGCGGGDDEPAPRATATAEPTAAATPAVANIDGCIEAGPGVRIRGDRATLGSGRTVVVTVSGEGGDACQWLELAQSLAGEGLSVVVSATSSGDTPQAVLANIRRAGGDRRVTLLSTSAGASAAIRAADRAGDRVAALATLSAVRYGDGTDALPRASRLGIPMLHVGSRRDVDTNLGQDTRDFRGTGRTVIVAGDAHGTELIDEHPALAGRIGAFLRDG